MRLQRFWRGAGPDAPPRQGEVMAEDSGYMERRKLAELTSAFGAGVLGAGIALLFAEVLAPYAVAILLVGFLSHGWGMYQRHRLDSGTGVAVPWIRLVYWICWVALAGLALYLGLTLPRA